MDDRLVLRLLDSARIDGELRKKSDAEIADLLLQEVWSEEDVTTRRCALIEHAIDRLHRAKGGPLPPEDVCDPQDEDPADHVWTETVEGFTICGRCGVVHR